MNHIKSWCLLLESIEKRWQLQCWSFCTRWTFQKWQRQSMFGQVNSKNWNLRSGPWISRSSFRCAVAMIWRWDSVCQCWPHDQLKVDCTAVIWWTYWHICYSICLLFDFVETDPQNWRRWTSRLASRLQAPSMRIQFPHHNLTRDAGNVSDFNSSNLTEFPEFLGTSWHLVDLVDVLALVRYVRLWIVAKSAKRPVRRQGQQQGTSHLGARSLVSDDILPTKNIQKKNSILRRETHVKDLFKHLQSIFSPQVTRTHKDCPCC